MREHAPPQNHEAEGLPHLQTQPWNVGTRRYTRMYWHMNAWQVDAQPANIKALS